jgi:hypothetical protein
MVAEIEYLDGGAIIFHLWVDTIKYTVPSDHREWDPDMKEWTIWPPHAVEALTFTRQTFGYVREANADIPGIRGGDHFTLLHLLPTAPLAVIEASYRALARLHHPDAGGNAEYMKRLNAARDALKGAS